MCTFVFDCVVRTLVSLIMCALLSEQCWLCRMYVMWCSLPPAQPAQPRHAPVPVYGGGARWEQVANTNVATRPPVSHLRQLLNQFHLLRRAVSLLPPGGLSATPTPSQTLFRTWRYHMRSPLLWQPCLNARSLLEKMTAHVSWISIHLETSTISRLTIRISNHIKLLYCF